jgi:hypothetical protein
VEKVLPSVSAAAPAGATKTETTTSAGTADVTPGKAVEPPVAEDAELTRFDKHPRFQQLIQQNRELKAQVDTLAQTIGARNEGLSDGQLPQQGRPPSDVLDQLLSNKTDEEILEMQAKDPKGFLAAFATAIGNQVQNAVLGQITQRSTESKIEATYGQFAKNHADFDARWADGTIGRFMQENPGHNALSAYHELTSQEAQGKTQKDIDAAVNKAVVETEKRILAEIRAKGASAVLGAGPATHPAATSPHADPRLAKPKDYGGKTAVLAERLRERRQANRP